MWLNCPRHFRRRSLWVSREIGSGRTFCGGPEVITLCARYSDDGIEDICKSFRLGIVSDKRVSFADRCLLSAHISSHEEGAYPLSDSEEEVGKIILVDCPEPRILISDSVESFTLLSSSQGGLEDHHSRQRS